MSTQKTNTFFRKVPRFTIYDKATAFMISAINTATDEGVKISINAGKRGVSIAFNGQVLLKGKTPEELSKQIEELTEKWSKKDAGK